MSDISHQTKELIEFCRDAGYTNLEIRRTERYTYIDAYYDEYGAKLMDSVVPPLWKFMDSKVQFGQFTTTMYRDGFSFPRIPEQDIYTEGHWDLKNQNRDNITSVSGAEAPGGKDAYRE